MNTRSREKTGSGDGDMLVSVARTIGSALGTVASKISRTPKIARRRRKASKTAVAKRARTGSAKKTQSKRRK